jgi:hypothetical protein
MAAQNGGRYHWHYRYIPIGICLLSVPWLMYRREFVTTVFFLLCGGVATLVSQLLEDYDHFDER